MMAANLYRAREQSVIARVVRYQITGRKPAGDGSEPPGLVLFRFSANRGRGASPAVLPLGDSPGGLLEFTHFLSTEVRRTAENKG